MQIRLSDEIAQHAKIQIDNVFITDFLPFAPETYVKVYLAGLSLASFPSGDNAWSEISRILGVDQSTVSEAFNYWANAGVVNLLSTVPPTVEYLPVGKQTLALRKFSKTKYKDFNDQLCALLPKRNILPNEYNEYYSLMESLHIEPTALLAVVAYSVRQKGADVPYQYVLAVARNLASQGCLTYDRVNEQLSEFDLYDKDLMAVIKALGSTKKPTIEDKRLFRKWTKELGFPLETVVSVAKKVKRGGMDKLDALMTRYYENRLFTAAEIDAFESNRDRMYDLARSVNRIIGVYYEQLDYIIETYIGRWLALGFDDETILTVAEYCFRRGVRTLEGMNETVEKFYRQGLLSRADIESFMTDAVKTDSEIRAVLDRAGVTRPVNSRDRDSYRTWTHTWKTPEALIDYAAISAAGTSNPVAYMNALLGSWHAAGITELDAAKNYKSAEKETAATTEVTKTYTSEQLNALFDSLDSKEL